MRLPQKKSIRGRRTGLGVAWTAGALFCGVLACLPARAQEANLEGQRVAEVRILDDSGKSLERETGSLPLCAGEQFDIAKERDTLRELYRSGDYEDIRVVAASTAQGLRVDFLVRRNYFNNAIRVEGLKEPPSEPAALASMRLGLGEPFRER